jgi:hypothetical protein
VVGRVDNAEPLVGPGFLVTRSLLQIEHGDLALVQVRADPVPEGAGLGGHVLARDQVLVQAAEGEVVRFERGAVRDQHLAEVGVAVPDADDRRPPVL